MTDYKKMTLLVGLLIVLSFAFLKIGKSGTKGDVAKATDSFRNIMFAGDSVTYGAYEPRGGYRYFLEQKMTADACDNYAFVGPYTENSVAMVQKNHAGLSGQKTLAFLNNLREQQLVAHYQVDSLYVMLGINDYFYGNWDQASIWMPRIISEAKLQNPKIKIYLLAATGLNPAVYTDPDYALAQSYYNRDVKRVAEENSGKNVFFIDTSSLDSNMFSDGEHPNALGYGKIANTIYDSVGRCLGVDYIPPPVESFQCDKSYGTCGCVGSDCRNEGGSNSDWRCCHRECIDYACRTVFGENMPSTCDPPDGTACNTTKIPDFQCDKSYGTCGCVGSDCRNEGGSNSDWRCCHRECIDYACRTVFGENMPSTCDPPDGTACGR